MHWAAVTGQTFAMEFLFNFKADVNARDKEGNTPLIPAASTGHAEATQWLIDFGADVDAKNQEGWTALNSTEYKGNLEVVKILLKAGAKPVPPLMADGDLDIPDGPPEDLS